MRRLSSLAVIATMLLTILVAAAPPARAIVVCADASLQGCWSEPFAENPLYGDNNAATATDRPPQTVAEAGELPTAVSAVVTPTGRVVYWDGLTGLENANNHLALDAGNAAREAQSAILDLTGPSGTPIWYHPTNPGGGAPDDLFCADQRLMANGKVIVAGGTDYQTNAAPPLEEPNPVDPSVGNSELYGSKNTRLYVENASSGSGAWDWKSERDMKNGRWYPTLVTQPDGTLFIAGGVRKLVWNTAGINVKPTEIYDPVGDLWAQNGADGDSSLPLFARMHLLPSGEILYDGDGQMWAPAGQALDEAVWNLHATYDTGTGKWRQNAGVGAFGARSGAFSVLLPLKAPYDQAQILMGGGVLGMAPGAYLGTNLSELITAKDADSDGAWETTSQRTADMVNRRWYSSGVLLPNGHVIALNGADKDEVVAPGSEAPVRQAELWDGSSWRGLSLSGRDRTYHNSALLLPDGSVLVGGHAPINAGYGAKGDPANDDPNALGTRNANNLRDPSFEQFYPPYLFDADGTPAGRPVINSVQGGVTWGQTFAIGTTGAGQVKKVVLYRTPAVTHTTDADNRAVEIPFAQDGGQTINATVPSNPSVVPPGYYYLFLLKQNGTPSVARIIKVSDTADATPAPAITMGMGAIRPVDQPAVPVRRAARGGASAGDVAAPASVAVTNVSVPARRGPAARGDLALVGLAALALGWMGARARRLARART